MKEFYFAEEKAIRGKKDNGKHDGKAANVRRDQESKQQVKEVRKK